VPNTSKASAFGSESATDGKADAHQEKQGSQRSVARLNRLFRVITQWVTADWQGNLTKHPDSEAMGIGQLLQPG
jgi:hypothetical protein